MCSEELKFKHGEDDVVSVAAPKVIDSYILFEDTIGVSDHCPVVAIVKIA